MGGCVSLSTNRKLGKQDALYRNTLKRSDKLINASQSEYGKGKERKYKLLLLGTGESGKSTLAKQVRIMHGSQYTPHELFCTRPILHQNLIESMKQLVRYSGIFSRLGRNTQVSERNVDRRDKVAHMSVMETFTFKHYLDFSELLSDSGIRKTISYRNEFQLTDTTDFLFNHMKDYANPDYLPQLQDLLHCRQRTRGVVKIKFTFKDNVFEIFDVGGQTSERKKWIHVFDDVSAIIFVTAISGYNQTTWEDDSINRMVESISVFRTIDNLWSLQRANIPMIIFFNKEDLFNKKINSKLECNKLSNYFKDYTGDNWNKCEVIEFFQNKFREHRQNKTSSIYFHLTSATNGKSIQNIFDSCADSLIDKYEMQKITENYKAFQMI